MRPQWYPRPGFRSGHNSFTVAGKEPPLSCRGAAGRIQYGCCPGASWRVVMANAPLSLGVQRQMEIYLAGLHGQQPAQAIAAEELEQQARAVLRPEAYIYVAGGAGAEDTVRANREAFHRWRIVPRFLRDV